MRIIPVIDLMQGTVVRGIAGKREEYRPVVSTLCKGSSPGEVGEALARLGFQEVYVADLDAIAGAEPDWGAYSTLMDQGLQVLVDAGAGTRQRVASLANFTHDNQLLGAVIVGLESLASEVELAASIVMVSRHRLVFSLDLRSGVPITRANDWRDLAADTIAERVARLGIRRMIVLDVAQVGVDAGICTGALCRRLRASYPSLEIISGGGVRHVDDLTELAEAGCDAALVASALHDGRLTATDLRRFTSRRCFGRAHSVVDLSAAP
jgi:phosphoribosylformimino-5-aminoimidazole carboxamide ribotide isomerase